MDTMTEAPSSAINTVEVVDETAPIARSRLRLAIIILALDTVLFIAALDQTIVATAIPTIASDLGSATGYTWIGGAYLLGSAAAGPIWTKCSDIWGRKPALLASVFIFAIASLIAALSISMNMLIAARALQGVAGGGIMQMVAVSTSDLFSLRHRAIFFSLQGGVYVIAGSVGPLLGGLFAEYASWRWCFWLNLPCCGTSFILLFFMNTHDPKTPILDGLKALDWAGTVAMLGMVLLLLLGLDFGGVVFPWNSVTVMCLLIFGGAMIGVFVLTEKKAHYPLMPLKVFTILSNNAIILVAAGHSMINTGVEFYLPLYFQSVKQITPFKSGLLMLPLMMMAAATDISSGFVISKTSRYREIVWLGAALMTLGTGLYTSLWSDTPISHVIAFELVSGMGVALLYQAPMLAVQSTVRQSDVASATATLSCIRNISTAISVVVGGVIFQGSMDIRRPTLDVDTKTMYALSQAAAHVDVAASLPEPAKSAVLDVFAGSVRSIFIFYVATAGVSMLASAFVKQGHLSSEHEETRTGLQHLSGNEKATSQIEPTAEVRDAIELG